MFAGWLCQEDYQDFSPYRLAAVWRKGLICLYQCSLTQTKSRPPFRRARRDWTHRQSVPHLGLDLVGKRKT